jgi:DNA-binding beta-propeller fold protein YncE
MTLAADRPPLQLVKKIPLGQVSGRIDHLAVDLGRKRLFVAELGNNSIGVVDLNSDQVSRTLKDFAEPQGIAYEPNTDSVYIASGDDGSVHILRGEDLAIIGKIELGGDADNIRVDPVAKRVYVGFGSGGLALIDAASRRRIATIPLSAHPEGFQLDPASSRVFVNVPLSQEIAVLDREMGRQVASWSAHGGFANFPLAVDAAGQRVFAVFRTPARLKVYSSTDGTLLANMPTCGDSDDVFFDAKRQRIYVSCGEGFVDVFDSRSTRFERIARIETVSGARTSLFVPDLDRLFLAVRASMREDAAVWVFQTGR